MVALKTIFVIHLNVVVANSHVYTNLLRINHMYFYVIINNVCALWCGVCK